MAPELAQASVEDALLTGYQRSSNARDILENIADVAQEFALSADMHRRNFSRSGSDILSRCAHLHWLGESSRQRRDWECSSRRDSSLFRALSYISGSHECSRGGSIRAPAQICSYLGEILHRRLHSRRHEFRHPRAARNSLSHSAREISCCRKPASSFSSSVERSASSFVHTPAESVHSLWNHERAGCTISRLGKS
jgi:hypothetical protein